MTAQGPLRGIRVLEFAGLGPAPFTGMMLSDLGASVLRIDRPGAPDPSPYEVISRGRASLGLDLKTPQGQETARRLIARADILIEGHRPGVMERLGLGPREALALQPRLVYGRVTGWGQSGPLAQAAGHDINYIALTGALAALGKPEEPPPPPLHLVGDYGGGALFLAVGVLSALWEARESGQGQVVDAAIVDGAALLMSPAWWTSRVGISGERGDNILDGSSHFYRCYACADGRYVAVGALEPRFYAVLLAELGLPDGPISSQAKADWESNAQALAALFRRRTQAEWCARLEGTDACFAPVLTLTEAPDHPHMQARGVFVAPDGVLQPAPAPRFSRTPGAIQGPPPAVGEGGEALAEVWGVRLPRDREAT